MSSPSALEGRIVLLNRDIEKRRLDAMLVTGTVNVTYLSGFLGDDACILATRNKKYFITDSRYIEDARRTLKGFEIRPVKKSTYEALTEIVKSERLEKIGFESTNLPYEVATRLGKLLGHAKLVPTKGFVEGFRAVKDDGEIRLIRQAVKLTKDVLERAVELVKPGVSEDRIARCIEIEFINRGSHAAFDVIVASGANSSMPHARPGAAKITNNSFVMIDIGCVKNRYSTDMTRMIVLGRPSPRFKKIYDIVRRAHDMAIDSIGPGIMVADVDLKARRYIQKQGFGKCFGHSLGHGVGMEVH
ncbi:MAG: Xaa-Pro peptidase family protein, partial [Candidatus Omnitrophica bacterium]|nr:Xaa-Pro peptidase family protein [Candidatus Omnitrophota bacterium]